MIKTITIALFFFCMLIVNGKITNEQLMSINTALATINQLENQCTTSSDCSTEPIGARACGGPNGYIVYSTISSYVEYIHSLAKLTTKLERQYNEENSIVSICILAKKPIAICDKNHTCVAQ
ncbi:unnamed protein product [Rotaria sp. Silwood2]|nr:unnamed protein product [Rotaria sp. Silwood2]CAF2475259.1 unnamed protein product [Rotaria sp. Silwood2]CAF2861277.1 unnamed protein product [Rotaria sp. Silwood2]CAF4024017.1 unnamed protein product [Rotaria sp. Silwood2]CAF4109282.1 unnamed protein product [Rotaria sp. Silwood2]